MGNTMHDAIYYAMAFITLLLSVGVIWITLNRLHCGKCKRSRLKYTVVLLAALVTGLQPYFFNQLPGVGSTLLILSVLWLLIDGTSSLKEHKNIHESLNDIEIVIKDGK